MKHNGNKKMLKKILIATAITLASFGSVAAIVAITPESVSIEGAAGAATVESPDVVVTVQADYAVGDLVTFTVTGALLNAAAPRLNHAPAGGGSQITAGLLSRTPTSVTYRITNIADAGNGSTTGSTLALTGLQLTTASVIDAVGNISVAYSAQTSTGTAVDNTGTLTDVALTVFNQFSATTTRLLNAVVDVESDRQQFTGAGADIRNDVLQITPVDNTPNGVFENINATYTGSTITIGGNFAWMDTDDTPGVSDEELDIAFMAGAFAGDIVAVPTINATSDLITVVVTDVGGIGDVGITNMTFMVAGVGAGNAILPTSTYTVNTTLRYTTAANAPRTIALQTNEAAGAWTLNGAQAVYNYVAVGFAGLQNTLTLSNSGTRAGAVILEAFDEAGIAYVPVTLTNELAPNSNMKISGKDIAEAFDLTDATKLSVTVTVNAPANAIDFSGFTQVVGTGRQLMNVVVQQPQQPNQPRNI